MENWKVELHKPTRFLKLCSFVKILNFDFFKLFECQSSGSPNAAMILHYLHESCESEFSARRKTTSKIQPLGSTLHYTNIGILITFQTI